MADPTQENALRAMRKAYEAGNMEAARKMARLAKSLEGQGRAQPESDQSGFMGQANRGIADTVGGMVDFVNPFDAEVFQDTPLGTGSAQDGLANAMQYIGADVAPEGDPEGMVQGFGRGVGNASGAIIPVVKGLQALRTAGGAVGAFADDAVRALSTVGGFAAETAAGGVGGAAREYAKDQGAPEWVQTAAEVAAPAVALPTAVRATGAATRAAGSASTRLPIVGAASRVTGDVARGMMPMTESGAMQVAGQQARRVAGGDERAGQLASEIGGENPLNLTPAQQTGDETMMGIERAARSEYPTVDESLVRREADSRNLARDQVQDMGGDVADARQFFDQRIREFRKSMHGRVDRVMKGADAGVSGAGNQRSQSANSAQVVQNLKGELADAEQGVRQMWSAVPQDVEVGTAETRTAVQDVLDNQSWFRRGNVPNDLRALAEGSTPVGETGTVREMVGLYSQMRQIARSAMAGNDQNKDMARIANTAADAVLADLAGAGSTPEVRRAVDEARAATRALHETFDQGAVGRILNRTIDGDETMTTEAALARTVGRGDPEARPAAENIEGASSGSAPFIQDYLREQFSGKLINASGEFTPRAAASWLRNNKEVIARYPGLNKQLRAALGNKSKAHSFSVRADARMQLEDAGGPISRFTQGKERQAVNTVLGADDPAAAARSLVRSARKDNSGKALEGLKGAFSDHLVGGKGDLTGDQLSGLLNDPDMRSAMGQVFSQAELNRFKLIATELGKIDVPGKDIGPLMDSPANRIIETIARIAAAKTAARANRASGGQGDPGVSLQVAQMASNRARDFLRNLTNERARDILRDAIENPELFKTLLTKSDGAQIPQKVRETLSPYLVGAGAQAASE